MSWTQLLAGLAGALSNSAGARPALPTAPAAMRRLPAPRYSLGGVAEAEESTRRMMAEAAREMARDFYDAEVSPWQKRVEDAESKVLDIDAHVVTRLDEMERLLDAINLKALDAQHLEKRLTVLIGLVAALFLMTLWFGLRTL